MNRLRRQLLIYSAPVAAVVVLVVVKLLSVVIAGHWAAADYTDRDADGLSGDVAILQVLDVVEPAKAPFAAGAHAVLEDRLSDADRFFTQALERTGFDESCPVRVNLVFVRETLGDRAAAVFDSQRAAASYVGAREVVEQAPPQCFAGNTDPDPARRDLRETALARLTAKIDAVAAIPPPPPPAPEASAPSAPPPGAAGAAPTDSPQRLNPGAGDPLDRLQQILRDAAAG